MFTFNFIEGDAKNPFPQLYSLVITNSAAKKFSVMKKIQLAKQFVLKKRLCNWWCYKRPARKLNPAV
jgi:hypothetical protein